MTIGARKEYLKAIRERYKQSSKSEKTAILNEFCVVCSYARKHAIRVLNGTSEGPQKRPGPKSYYDDEFTDHLVRLWKSMGNICSKKMIAALPIWLPFYRHPKINSKIREKLLKISSSTIDRCLKRFKEKGQGLSGTVTSHFKNQIPLQLLKESDLKTPGFIEADTVAHCGTSLTGQFAWTLTMTDLYSGWTENRAVWTKDSYRVLRAVMEIEDALPFCLEGFASDNGTEFLNSNLSQYLYNRKLPVNFVRRRPYKKNDNAHVEQKNFTHVRNVFGYERVDQKILLDLMNEIYRSYWNPLQNYFTPSLKLLSKTRVGGRIKKKYGPAKTPYQRLLESNSLTLYKRDEMISEYQSLNPFKMRKILDGKISQFFRIMDTRKKRSA